MQPLAPLSVHNTAFQRLFAQQRCHRLQRRHTTNQQRCHWLQIPPADCQIGKTVGLSPSTHATAGTTVGPAPSTHATTGTTVGLSPSTHATAGTTVGPQHRISAIFTQQRCYRFQRPHTTNQQRCHWLQIPPVDRHNGKISASTPVSAANPPSKTNYTKRPRQQPHEQTVNNLRTGPR